MDKVRELWLLFVRKKVWTEKSKWGGIDDQTIAQAKEKGATVFVADSYVFKGDVNERVHKLTKNKD